MKIDAATIKLWSGLGSRATLGLAALELGKEIENLVIITGDTSTSAGLGRFKKAFPEKFLDVGIAEQNLIGVAAGLSREGATVVTATFAPFQTMRCCEQIKMNLGYMNQKVCLVGLASGVVQGPLGFSHCAIEDVAIMRSIPGITVVSPADCTETAKAFWAAVRHGQSVYLRLLGDNKSPPVYSADYSFEIGKAIPLRSGSDVAIIAAGTMVHESLEAAKILEAAGISASVINMHTVKPLDTGILDRACGTARLLVTVEEHSVIGGLGSAVAEYKTTLKGAPPQLTIGLPCEYGRCGVYRDMLAESGLTAPQIASRIIRQL